MAALHINSGQIACLPQGLVDDAYLTTLSPGKQQTVFNSPRPARRKPTKRPSIKHSIQNNIINMSDPWAGDTGDDDDDVYEDDCPRLDMLPASAPISSDLYTDPNAAATKVKGSTKSHFTPVPGGSTVLDTGDKSDYQFSVERLAWVDGWQSSTTVNGKLVQKQPMTLVVLKFLFQSFNQDLRVESVKATLQFKDANQLRGDDPEVQAWAPFHDLETWNPGKAHNTKNTSTNASASGGYAGSSLSLGWSQGRQIAWDRTDFDEGRSILVKSKRKQRPIGVTWYMKQNRLENLGVTPIIWAAVLIKRATPDSPYLVKFRLDVRTGTRHDLESKVKDFLRIKPGDTSSFTATPRPGIWDKINCFGEGEAIRDSKSVDLDNLGTLLAADRTALHGTWGPQYQRSAPSVKGAEEDQTATPEATARITIAVDAREKAHAVTPLEATSNPANLLGAGPPPELPLHASVTSMASTARCDATQRPISSPVPVAVPVAAAAAPFVVVGTAADALLGRLVALEARMAQTEARLAAQDLQILQLQRDVDARDARLARMEQAMPVAATLSQL